MSERPVSASWAGGVLARGLRSFSVYAPRQIRAIAAEVDPSAPLCHLLFHPIAVTANADSAELLVESMWVLLQRLPLLQRFELLLSLSRSAPAPPSPEADPSDHVERCLDSYSPWRVSKDGIDCLITAFRVTFERAAKMDPQRVFVIEGTIVLSGPEREAQRRARIKPRSKRNRCAGM